MQALRYRYALGEVFGDSGVDAAAYLAQTADDAGNLLVPFRAEKAPPTFALAPNYRPLATLRLGGVLATAPLGEMDDSPCGIGSSRSRRSPSSTSETCRLV
ncbi:MAG: hypothetical protein IPG50_27385 [Myxococcales bacterium]|nr:hypothetical protein [Myxococcales bacterium]